MIDAIRKSDRDRIGVLVFDNLDLFNWLSKIKDSLSITQILFVPRFARQDFPFPVKYIIERKYYAHRLRLLAANSNKIKIVYCFSIYQNHFCYQVIFSLFHQLDSVMVYSPVVFDIRASIASKLISLPRKVLNRLVYGKGFTAVNVGHKTLDVVIPGFFESKKITRFDREACDKIKGCSEIRDFFIYEHNYKVIYFDQPLVNYGRVDADKFKVFFQNVVDILSRHIDQGMICVKLHPGNHTDEKIFNGIPIIAGEIPSQAIQIRPGQLWLSVSSQSIWCEIPGVQRISLLNLIEFSNHSHWKTIYDNFVNTSEGDVFIPKTLSELESYIAVRN